MTQLKGPLQRETVLDLRTDQAHVVAFCSILYLSVAFDVIVS